MTPGNSPGNLPGKHTRRKSDRIGASASGRRPADELVRFVAGWRRRKIVVAGDFMLDRYVYGNADRLSPDAPVPVLWTKSSHSQPGGAGNVCRALRALQCDVACLGIVGDDEAGKQLREALEQDGCDTSGLIAAPDRPTTVKHDFVGLAQQRHPQKMFRVDDESRAPISRDVVDRLLAKARRLLKGAAVLCLEDYNKGLLITDFCQGLIAVARAMNIRALIDPALINDYRKYRGATCVTPNRTEAALATDVDFSDTSEPKMLEQMARTLMSGLKLEAVVMTLDKQGLLLVEKRRRPQHVTTKARSVYDVTGAGDIVLAMLAGALANGATWHTAVELANTAAGLEVEKFGVVPIELDEVLLNLLEKQNKDLGKRRQFEPLLFELNAYRKQGKRIVFTNGCFDILHAGHIGFLRAAREAGDLLVIGLNSDASIRRIKGKDRPVNLLNDRLMVLSELQSVDYIVVFDEDTPVKLIEAIRPDVLAKGTDYTKGEVVGASMVESYGGRVELVKLIEGRSTTNIIHKISGGSVG